MPKNKLTLWVTIILITMLVYQVYNGFYFKKIGLFGFTIELEQTPQTNLKDYNLSGKTLYIHISSETQRNDANALLKTLADNSAKVFSVVNLVKEKSGSVPFDNSDNSFPEDNIQIRYFYPSDFEPAKRIKELLQRNNVIVDSHVNDTTKNPEGVIEIWYPWLTK